MKPCEGRGGWSTVAGPHLTYCGRNTQTVQKMALGWPTGTDFGHTPAQRDAQTCFCFSRTNMFLFSPGTNLGGMRVGCPEARKADQLL